MKNTSKVLGIIALVTVIWFSMTACGGNEDDCSGGLPDSTLTITDAQVYLWNNDFTTAQYVKYTGTVSNLKYVEVVNSNGKSDRKPLNELIDGNPSVTLINGKLSITLGKPKASSLQNFFSTIPPGVTVSTTGVKIFFISYFFNGSDPQDTIASVFHSLAADGVIGGVMR